ncbi:TPA: hypothetical protein HNN81_07200 [Escherichia coli]|uniref:Uncharacterized protein n=1 Tax=Escherichia coli TaxID=562 RepID=A0A485J9V9_ECOLX|nr:Uncharacterised protein [Escherichia coli]HAJ7035164.1 hypothetical protein [Escherichia coli]
MIVNIIRLHLHYSVLLIENYFLVYYPCGNNVLRSDNLLNNEERENIYFFITQNKSVLIMFA